MLSQLLPHQLVHNAAKAATCTQKGNIEYWQCSVCNKMFKDVDGTTEITDVTTRAKGHQCDPSGLCFVCGETDQRFAQFTLDDNVTITAITDNDDYQWQVMDLTNVGGFYGYFTIPEGSKGLMSSNRGVDNSTSSTTIQFKSTKAFILSFDYACSVFNGNTSYIILVDGRSIGEINRNEAMQRKLLLAAGSHTLELSYKKDDADDSSSSVDRAFIYNLQASVPSSTFAAVYDNDSQTLTYRNVTSDEFDLLKNNMYIVQEKMSVRDVENALGIRPQHIVIDKSFSAYTPTTLAKFFGWGNDLQSISGLQNLNTTQVQDMSYMFACCGSLNIVDIEKLNTSNVRNFEGMFDSSSSLLSLDLSNFDTSEATSMYRMFAHCNALQSINFGSHFNTAKVKNMGAMFSNCSKLASLDLSGFNTESVNDRMDYMFIDCSNLRSIDLSSFNTRNVRTMSCMFRNCGSLESITFGDKFTAENTVSFDCMFMECHELKAIDLSSFNLKRAEYIYAMFSDCNKLETIDFGAGFNTERVDAMHCMFENCKNLKELDLSGFDTRNVFRMDRMFYMSDNAQTTQSAQKANIINLDDMFKEPTDLEGIDLPKFDASNISSVSANGSLERIYVSDKFVTTNVHDSGEMFYGCQKLPNFDATTTNVTHANYKAEGYFVKLVGKVDNEKLAAVGDPLTLTTPFVADDNKNYNFYEPFMVNKATYNRTLSAGTTWATLCLPFEFAIDGQSFRAFKLLSATDDVVELEEVEGNVEAGMPLIIKMNDGATQISVSASDKLMAESPLTNNSADNLQLIGLYGQKQFDKAVDNNCYILKGNKLMNPAKLLENASAKKVGLKAFRTYMVDSNPTSAQAKAFSLAENRGEITAIDQLTEVDSSLPTLYYNAQGQRLAAPQKGINLIKCGNTTLKVIIK